MNNIKESLKRKKNYIFKDILGQVIFVSIILESMFFVKILNSAGAAKFKRHMDTSDWIVLSRIHLYILFTMALLSFTYLFSERVRYYLQIVLKILVSVVLLSDIWYYRGFKDFISWHNMGETQNMHNLHGTALAMGRRIDYVFLIFNIIILIFAIFVRKRYKSKEKEKGMFAVLFLIPFVIILTLHLAEDFRGNNYHGDVIFHTEFIPYATMRNITPIGYHFYDTLEFIKDSMAYNLTSEDKKEIKDWLNYKNENLPSNDYNGMFKGKNLIFVQVESLENFVINEKYNGQELTPNMNNMLKNSLYFSNFYEQVNNGNSGDADLMVNASVLPVRRGSTFFRFPNNQYNTLSKLLGEDNYYSRCLHAADGNIWNINRALEDFGFDQYWDIKDFKGCRVFNMGVADEDFLNKVADMTTKDKQPFYYYAVTVSSHVPFRIPDELKGLNMSKSFDNSAMGSYFQAINYYDRQIGNFINVLDKKGILDNSIVVIMGDHTGVHKYYNDKVESSKEKQAWWDNGLKVPFIIYSKNLQGKEIKTIGAQIDVLPTICSVMGVDESKYKNTTMGRNLLNTNKNYAILNDGTIVGRDKLSQKDIKHIKKSFDIADMITRSNYFKTNNSSK